MVENPDVKKLRAEIDLVDDGIMELIERRLSLAARMAAAKKLADQESPLRPGREASILKRLKDKARLAPASLIEVVWRELIGHGRQAQGPMRLVVFATKDPDLLEECARRHFSSAIPIEFVESASEALEMARRLPAIAVVDRSEAASGLIELDQITTHKGDVVGYAYARVEAQ